MLFVFLSDVNSLRMTKMEVPLHVAAGQSVYLRCCYKMEGDELYSVKWYKGISEFYRYLPKDHPPAQVYEVQGVTVNVSGISYTVLLFL